MSARGWTGSVAVAAGMAAGIGAAQLGVGYGLGIIGWLGDTAGWAAALAWTVWVAALSVAGAALTAYRRTTTVDTTPWARGLWRASVACAAALGGLAVVPLTALPAREVSTAVTFAPAWVVGWYAAAGALIGLVLAIVVLSVRAAAANLIATASWWWLVAVLAVVDAVAGGRGLVPTQLGVWRFTQVESVSDVEAVALDLPGSGWWQSIYLPGAILMLGATFLIGLLAAWPAGRRGDSRAAVALSGVVGPVLLAAASVLAAPRLAGAPAEQVSALLIAPYAVIAGLAGSVLAAVLTAARPATSTSAEPAASAPTAPGAPLVEPATGQIYTPKLKPVEEGEKPAEEPASPAIPTPRNKRRPRPATGRATVAEKPEKSAKPEEPSA
ncbi:MAG: hypothetical protein HOU81_14055 [Hamadaea sp.]|uniref:hypothetical protein n=1 Tax=Hamadaea sp. TaxID=2024425 RepID=UPI0017C69DDD|nr:hypothetical protein [Hamadaea sp.]NUR71939.1 hypothetical protein [Hamadaea sp.]NUT22858.1 hypothetical protein [Hamadaea sp.]